MLLTEHEGAVEADLLRVYGIDYRDRWRPGSGLSLRRIYQLLKHMPPEDSATLRAITGRAHWSTEAHLLDSLRMTVEATAGAKRPPKPHPLRPTSTTRPRAESPERRRKLAAARARARERRRRIEAGEIT